MSISLGNVTWESLMDYLHSSLTNYGYDLIVPLNSNWYNEAVNEDLRLVTEDGKEISNTLLFLVGNSKCLWEPFINYYTTHPIPQQPLDDYSYMVSHEATKGNEHYPSPDHMYWIHIRENGRLIAYQKMAAIAGLASLCNKAHLLVHPKYKTWMGLRFILLYKNIDPPTAPIYDIPREYTYPDENKAKEVEDLMEKAIEAAKNEAGQIRLSETSWKYWLRSRISVCPEGIEHQYNDLHLMYHYAKFKENTFQRIIKAAIDRHAIDYTFYPPEPIIQECRDLIQSELRQVIAEAGTKRESDGKYELDGIILSGGLDTSILAEAIERRDLNEEFPAKEYLNGKDTICHFKGGITVTITDAAPRAKDAVYASKIAKKLDLPHHLIDISLDKLLNNVQIVSKLLCNFDPMEMRNAIVVYEAIKKAAELGFKKIMVGDASDEIFAGYQFFYKLDEAELIAYRNRMMDIMTFFAQTLADSFNIHVVAPYTRSKVVGFARNISRKDLLVNEKTPVPDLVEGYGKWILRRAFPEATSQWRCKEPIEVGSGSTLLGRGYFDKLIDDGMYESERIRIYQQDDVYLHGKEQFHYYREFMKNYGSSVHNIPIPRYAGTDEECPACHFNIKTKSSKHKQDFCLTCGFYPTYINEKTNDLNKKSYNDMLQFKEKYAK